MFQDPFFMNQQHYLIFRFAYSEFFPIKFFSRNTGFPFSSHQDIFVHHYIPFITYLNFKIVPNFSFLIFSTRPFFHTRNLFSFYASFPNIFGYFYSNSFQNPKTTRPIYLLTQKAGILCVLFHYIKLLQFLASIKLGIK